MNDTQENDQLTLMIMATTLSKKYDEWSQNSDVMDVLNVNTNNICIYLKDKYPYIEDSIAQSVSLAFLLYLYLLVTRLPRLSNLDVD